MGWRCAEAKYLVFSESDVFVWNTFATTISIQREPINYTKKNFRKCQEISAVAMMKGVFVKFLSLNWIFDVAFNAPKVSTIIEMLPLNFHELSFPSFLGENFSKRISKFHIYRLMYLYLY